MFCFQFVLLIRFSVLIHLFVFIKCCVVTMFIFVCSLCLNSLYPMQLTLTKSKGNIVVAEMRLIIDVILPSPCPLLVGLDFTWHMRVFKGTILMFIHWSPANPYCSLLDCPNTGYVHSYECVSLTRSLFLILKNILNIYF